MTEPTHVAATLSVMLEPGAVLGSWELVGLIGKGAMGRVYRARHVKLGREVAIKFLNPEYVARPDVVQRFFREARVVNEIDHEHIVEVTDFVEAPGLAYLVMELLEGESLRDLSKRRGRRYPPSRRIAGILRQVCEALEAAHAKGVVHRDLKPDNVFVVERDGADFAKVLDFGVARLLDGGDESSTMAGMILGTPHYMSPEQALGKPVGRDADIWAAGVVLFELLAGSVPFTAPSFVELAIAIREQPPRPLPAKTPRGERIPPWLAAVALRCLEKRPEDRYRTMAQLAQALTGPALPSRWPKILVAAAAAAALGAGAVAAVKLGVPRRAAELAGSAIAVVRGSAGNPAVRPERPSTSPPLRGGYAQDDRKDVDASERSRRAETSTPTSTPTRTPTPARKAAAAPAPKAPTKPAPPAHASTKPAAAKPRPPPQPTVELRIHTSPPGAAVVRLDTGKRIGKTPLRLDLPRKDATIWLELRLDGHAPVKFAADLRKDVVASVTLERAKRAKAARR